MKKKTKEIDVWVDPDGLDNLSKHGNRGTTVWNKDSEGLLKAKLIVELPERTWSGTESQFDEAVKNIALKTSHADLFEGIKEKLFGREVRHNEIGKNQKTAPEMEAG